MLTGSADPRALAARAAALERFDTEPLKLPSVETLQVCFEYASAGMEALLPPALHPTLPPVVGWQVQRFASSPWGSFAMALCRIECRSGLRPRGFLLGGAIDNAEAGAQLASRWGYSLRPGAILLSRGYDRIRASVSFEGAPALELELRDPTPLRGEDVFYAASMHLAHTPRGLRLVQVDPAFATLRAERGRPVLERFDAAGWNAAGVRPSHPVSASFTLADVTLPALRYVCRPDVLAFEGSERIDG